MKAKVFLYLCVSLFALSTIGSSAILASDFEPDLNEGSFWLKLIGFIVTQIVSFFAGKKSRKK